MRNLIACISIAVSSAAFGQTDTSATPQRAMEPANAPFIPVSAMRIDTLVTSKNERILGKITKISDTEIEYKRSSDPDAPVYAVNRNRIKEIRWANGTVEKLVMDELDVNKELEVIDKRSALKFHFFSPVNDQLRFSYEHSLKVGLNAEFSLGFVNNSMFHSKLNDFTFLIQGFNIAGGAKFLLGTDYYVKGLKYTHPLKGRYIKPEIIYSQYTIRSIKVRRHNVSSYYYDYDLITFDKQVSSAAVVLNYGRQFILGNVVTLSYNIGVGYSFTTERYSDPSVDPDNKSSGYWYDNDGYRYNYKRQPENVYSHINISNLPIAVTGGLTLGYLFK